MGIYATRVEVQGSQRQTVVDTMGVRGCGSGSEWRANGPGSCDDDVVQADVQAKRQRVLC